MKLPDRVAFTVPGLGMDIYWYAIFITIGILAAVVVTGICTKKRRMPTDTAIDLCLLAVPLGLIFARLYYVVFDLSSFRSFADVINIRNGGLAIPGGIIGGLLGLFIYSLIKKKPIWGYADTVAPGLALAQAIGRWGNFFNQEAYGAAITNPKLLFFPLAVKIEHCNCGVTVQHGHMATFFYESVFCLIIFAILLTLTLRKKMKHNGDILLLYVLLYTFERAIIEQFRMDSLMLGKIRITQLLCIISFTAVILFLVIRAVYEKKTGRILCAISYDEYYVPQADDEKIPNEGDDTDDDSSESQPKSDDNTTPSDTTNVTEPAEAEEQNNNQ